MLKRRDSFDYPTEWHYGIDVCKLVLVELFKRQNLFKMWIEAKSSGKCKPRLTI